MKVLVIDDHPVIARGLRNDFRPSRDGVEFISVDSVEKAVKLDPASFEVILLDLSFPKGSTTPGENIKSIQTAFPGIPVIIYTGTPSIGSQREMYLAGAKGYLSKDAKKSEILDMLKRVVAGETVYTTEISEYQNKQTILGHLNKDNLTVLDKRIIPLFIEGWTTIAISQKFDMNRSTIDKSIRHIKSVYGINTTLNSDVALVKKLLGMD